MVKQKLRHLKYRLQRFKKGYSDMDTWNIYNWFLETVPNMLQELRDNHCGHPFDLTEDKWNKILDKMIFCFNEASEDKCSKVNKYEKDFDRVYDEFHEQYGAFGCKIPREPNERGCFTVITPSDEEIGNKEWQKILANYRKEELKIYKYREKMLAEGMKLFSEYFWNLWD